MCLLEEDHVAQPAADQQQHRRDQLPAPPRLPASTGSVEPAAGAGEDARAGPPGFEVVVRN